MEFSPSCKVSINLSSLPIHLIGMSILPFLCKIDIKIFLDSFRNIELRQKYFILRFNKKYCKEFCYSNIFRTKIHENSLISLSLSDFVNIKDVITDKSALKNVHTLSLSGKEITDVSALSNLHTLILRYCDNLIDVSALSNLHTLILIGCHNIINVSTLGNLDTLILINCSKIADMSALSRVKTLYVSGCGTRFR